MPIVYTWMKVCLIVTIILPYIQMFVKAWIEEASWNGRLWHFIMNFLNQHHFVKHLNKFDIEYAKTQEEILIVILENFV